MDQTEKIIVLIPAYNEEKRIVPVITQARTYLPVWVVDDGSRDQTIRVSQEAGALVIPQTPNQGKGAALRAGFRKALEVGCEAVITLDADGQHDPAEIPAFLDQFTHQRKDLIIGARDFSKMPLSRRLANSLGRVVFSWAMSSPIRDNQSGYRLLSRRMMGSLLESNENGFEFEVEMIQVCIKNSWDLTWVPIRTIYAGQGSHIHPVKHVVNFFRVALKAKRAMSK